MESPDVRVRIPGYRDLVRVGAGGFSMVYRAHQEAFDRTVAVKVLTVELVDETAQRRFQRECRASGRLSSHPNIVTVLDSGFTEDGRPFITTEFMSNGSLADRLDRGVTYPVAEVLDIGVKMCSALAAVHAAGILHRDIKPPNILVSDYDEPALADFGISAITVGPEASIGTSSLTPLHVAPEVLEGQPTSPASDVYSLGSTLYTLLAGRAPFQQSDDDALMPLMRRVVMDPVPDIDSRPDVPAEVIELLRYSMAKQPFSRYGTAVSFGEAIQATQAHLGYPVTPLRKPGTGAGDFVLPPAEPVTSPGEPVVAPDSAIVADPGLAGTSTAGPAHDHHTGSGPPPADTGPRPLGPPDGAGPPAAPPGGRSRALLAGIAVLVLVALIAAALVLRGRGDGTTAAAPGPGSSGSTPGQGNGPPSGDPTAPTPAGSEQRSVRFDIEPGSLDTATPTGGGVLRVGIDAEPASWNPATARFYGGTRLVADALFDPLTVLTAQGPQPYLASAVTPNAAFDEWTIEVPGDVKFHDGAPFDATAVKDNFEARLANDLLARPIAPVQSVRVDGDRAVVTLRQPWPAFPVALSGQSGLMAAPGFLASEAGDMPVGTGPFSFVRWEAGKKVTLTANTSYRIKDRPYLDGLDFSFILEPDARAAALTSGQLDVALITDPVSIDRLQSDYQVFSAREATVATVLLNAGSGVTADVRVRRALAVGTDTSALNDTVFEGKAYSASSPLPSGSPWANPDNQGQYHDAETARSLLAEAGFTAEKPLQIELLVGQSPRQRQTGELLQQQWSDIGVQTTLNATADPLEMVVAGTYQATFWTFDVPNDPDELYHWFHTDATPGEFTYNLARISDPNLDRGFENGRKASDRAARVTAYNTVQQELVSRAPAIWFAYLPNALVSAPRVVGWAPDSMGGVGRGGTPWATSIGFK